jgi:hypothetical protein
LEKNDVCEPTYTNPPETVGVSLICPSDVDDQSGVEHKL